MQPLTIALIMFGILFVLIILRIPVAISLAVAVVPILLLEPRLTPIMLLQRMMRSYNSFILLAIPFFILAANIMNESNITKRLVRFSNSLVGHLPGGLAHVNVVVSMFFAGISGASTADSAGIGSILIPAMIEEGYDRQFSVAVTACSSVMGAIIPPSIIMIVWGGVMNVSVAGLFLAGFIPGVMIGIFQMVVVLYFAFKRNYPIQKRVTFRDFLTTARGALLPLLTPVIIIGGIIGGLFTPTEASAVAVLYSLLVGVGIYRKIKIKDIPAILLKTAKLAGLSLFALGTASIYSWVLAFYKIPTYLVSALSNISASPTLMLFIIVGVFVVVGTFMDALPAIFILAPLLGPLAEHSGISPLHFAITSCIALAFGLITPPYGLCLLIASEIAGINSMKALKEVGIFLAAMLIILALIIAIPDISLGIPRLVLPGLFQ